MDWAASIVACFEILIFKVLTIGVTQGNIGFTVNVKIANPAFISAVVGVYIGVNVVLPVKERGSAVVHSTEAIEEELTILIWLKGTWYVWFSQMGTSVGFIVTVGFFIIV